MVESRPGAQWSDPRFLAMGASLSIAVLMLVGKTGAYWITGSTAILSDAAESVIHIVATGVASFGLWYSTLPPSRQHPYGYGKVTYFSAGLEGAFILLAAVTIIHEAVVALVAGPELRDLGIGILVIGGLGLVNLALGLYLVRVGKQRDSLVLIANGHHVLTDMWTSLGVVVGVTVVWLTNLVWLDPAVAILMGLNIVYTAFSLLRDAYFGLMERADPKHTLQIVDVLDRSVEDGLIASYHQLRHRVVADEIWIEVHMLVPGDMPVSQAHRNVTQVERRLRESVDKGKVRVTTHIEPTDHDRDHPEGHPGLRDALRVSAE